MQQHRLNQLQQAYRLLDQLTSQLGIQIIKICLDLIDQSSKC
jgi:hypothetical protein